MSQILVLLFVLGVAVFPTASTAGQQAHMQAARPRVEKAPAPLPVLRNIEFVGAATTNPGWRPSSTFGVWMPRHEKGDLLLAFISSGYAHAGDPPPGWALIRQDVKAHDDLAVQTYWRIAGAAVKAQTANSFRIDCPSVSAPTRGMLVCGWVLDDPDTVTAPVGMTQVSNFMIRNDDSHAVAFAPASGRTGIRSANINDVKGGSDDFAHAVALNPVPAPTWPKK